jgi:hypothetical protein
MSLSARIPRKVVKVPERKRPGHDPQHKKAVKKLPCVGCGGAEGVDPHHLKRAVPHNDGKGGMGMTATHKWTIPLCRDCHDGAHGAGDDERWLTERGVDGRQIAEALWRERGDDGAMKRVVERSLLTRGKLRT